MLNTGVVSPVGTSVGIVMLRLAKRFLEGGDLLLVRKLHIIFYEIRRIIKMRVG